MATNTQVYFPNVASANNKVVGATTTAAGSTIYTVPGAAYIRVTGFTVSLYMLSGGAATDHVTLNLKIGTGYYVFTLEASATITRVTSSQTAGSTVGFAGAWLQTGDTITTTVSSVVAGGATYIVDVSCTLEDYYV